MADMKEMNFSTRGFVVPFLITALFLAANNGFAAESRQEQPKQSARDSGPDENFVLPLKPSVTSHEITLDGSPLEYKATAGFMPIFDQAGKQKANMFYVAYEVPAEKDEKRPVTFAFNGGPGAAALWLHVGAFGPKTVSMDPSGTVLPEPPFALKDNANTLLGQSDLVFVDPVGTGFSRAMPEENTAEEFWGVRSDIASVGEFIRMYLNRKNRWNSRVFIAGESYGGLRAPGLVSYLQDMGVMPSGVVLLSPAPSFGDLRPDHTNERPFVHLLPAMAAAARYHDMTGGNLPSDRWELLEKARKWAQEEYLEALWEGVDLQGEERQRITEEMAAFTGLPRDFLQAENLRVPASKFAGRLLQDRGKFLSLYDSRVAAYGTKYSFSEDPLVFMTGPPYITSFRQYLANNLGLKIDRRYIQLNEKAGKKWDFYSGAENGAFGYPNVVGEMAKAMRRDPHLDLFVAMGIYDLVCPRASVIYSLKHMDIPPKRMSNITFKTYLAGHMLYTRESVHEKLKNDLTRFYRAGK